MIKISFDGHEVAVPENWADIRLGDYERWLTKSPSGRTEQVELIADICKVDASLFLDNPTRLFDVVAQTVSFVFGDFSGEPRNAIRIGDTEYRISFTEELTLAEWVDVESLFESDSNERLSDILSILCRPAGEAYDSSKTAERKKMFEGLTMDRALPMLAFFLHQRERSLAVSNHYFQVREEVNRYLLLMQAFAESGDGIKSLPIWQRIRYYYLMKSLRKQLSKFSDSFFTDSTRLMPRTSKANLQVG